MAEDTTTIGQRLRRIRVARDKTLQVIADRAGISYGYLGQLERGERALDSLKLIKDLAIALEIAPSELTRLPIPAPANGETDAAIQAVRLALKAVNHGRPGGQVLPLDVLREWVTATIEDHCRCDREREVGAALPGLIADLHTSLAAGRDVAELLDLAVVLHTQATVAWLRVAGSSMDLREQAVLLGRQAAQDRDTPTALGLAAWGGVHTMLVDGAFDLAQAELDSVTVSTNTRESMQLAGMLALSHSLVAAADNRHADMVAPLELGAELAERMGEGNAYWMGFGPTSVGFWRMYVALETGDHERAAAVAGNLRPEAHPLRSNQAYYWVDYSRSLARLRGRRDDAVMALRRAERISPHQVQREPLARGLLGELLEHSYHNAVARELRAMAWRADLRV